MLVENNIKHWSEHRSDVSRTSAGRSILFCSRTISERAIWDLGRVLERDDCHAATDDFCQTHATVRIGLMDGCRAKAHPVWFDAVWCAESVKTKGKYDWSTLYCLRMDQSQERECKARWRHCFVLSIIPEPSASERGREETEWWPSRNWTIA